MDNDYSKIVKRANVEVKIIKNKDKVIARVSIDLKKPPILIKGFTVRQKDGERFVIPPSYPNLRKSMSPIIWMPNELWTILVKKILLEYEKVARTSDQIESD